MSAAALPAWRQFICRACGLIYDEALGDADSGLAPGTRYEDIPDDWECPLCGVVKADFEPYAAAPAVRAGQCAAPQGAATASNATDSNATQDAGGAEAAQKARGAAAINAALDRAGAGRDPAGRHLATQRPRTGAAGVVIIGGGCAGWAAAEALRALDPALPLTLVAACAADRYHKPELSVALSRGANAASLLRESGADAARRLGVRLLAHTVVTGVSPELHLLRSTRGSLRYGQLVLAQGARPALPAVLPAALCWRVNDLAGWSGVQQRLQHGPRRVAIVGAGMVGCELADDFALAGHRVTLLDRHAEPLAALLPPLAGRRLRASLEQRGVRYVGAVQVSGVTVDGHGVKRIATADGRLIEADEVVAATGLATDARLARLAGLRFERGIAVDPATLQTSRAHIYALGDCISIDGAPCRYIEPIARQAGAIAHAITGRAHAGYAHTPPVIRLKTRSLPVVLHGQAGGGGEWRVTRQDEASLHMQHWRDGAPDASLQLGRAV